MVNRFVTAFKIATEYLTKGTILTTTGEVSEEVKDYFATTTKILAQTGVTFQTNAYNNCPQVQGVISKKVQSMLRGNLICVDKDGNQTKNSGFDAAIKLLKSPNKYQDYSNFMATIYTFQQVYGVAYIYKAYSVGFKDVQALIVLPNTAVEVVYRTVSDLLANDKKQLIDYYNITLNNRVYRIYDLELIETVNDVIINTELGGNYKPASRLDTLRQSVVNLIGSIECRGQYISNHGADVVISPERSNDAAATAMGMTKSEQDRLQKDYERYGITAGQYHALISKIPLKVQTIGRSIGDLGLFDGENQDHRVIAQSYGVPIPLLALPDTSKYATYGEAKKEMYEDTIMPESVIISEFLGRLFNAIDFSFMFDYSQLEVMQQSENEKSSTLTGLISNYFTLYQQGNITRNEYLQRIGENPVPGGDNYITESGDSTPLAVKLGVGGTQSLQLILADPNIDPESKINTLVILFGLSKEDATLMVSDQ
jgi:hypothetical protein